MKDFFDTGYFPKKIPWKAVGSGRFFPPSLETTESTLYFFSMPKTSNEVKYKIYSFDLYDFPVPNNHFFRIYCNT